MKSTEGVYRNLKNETKGLLRPKVLTFKLRFFLPIPRDRSLRMLDLLTTYWTSYWTSYWTNKSCAAVKLLKKCFPAVLTFVDRVKEVL